MKSVTSGDIDPSTNFTYLLQGGSPTPDWVMHTLRLIDRYNKGKGATLLTLYWGKCEYDTWKVIEIYKTIL